VCVLWGCGDPGSPWGCAQTLWTLTAAGAAETKDAPPARLRRAAIRGEQSIRALEKQQAKGVASGRDHHATLPGVPGERLLALASAVQASDASMPNGEGSAASMQPRPPSAPSNVLGKLTVLEAASGQRIDLHVESDSDSSDGDDVADRSRGVSSEKRGRHDIDNDDWSTSEDDIMSFSSEGDMFDSDGSDGDSSQGSHVHRHAHGSHLVPGTCAAGQLAGDGLFLTTPHHALLDWLFMHLQAKRQQSVSQGGTQPVKKRARKGTNGDTHGAGSKAAAVLVCSGCSKQYKTQKVRRRDWVTERRVLSAQVLAGCCCRGTIATKRDAQLPAWRGRRHPRHRLPRRLHALRPARHQAVVAGMSAATVGRRL